MNFDFRENITHSLIENSFVCEIAEIFENIMDKINEKLEEKIIDKKEEKLYYVYSYTPEKVYITEQKSDKLKLLEGVSDEFKKNLAEGFILRFKDGNYFVDEELTEKSMNFEFDFDNYKG